MERLCIVETLGWMSLRGASLLTNRRGPVGFTTIVAGCVLVLAVSGVSGCSASQANQSSGTATPSGSASPAGPEGGGAKPVNGVGDSPSPAKSSASAPPAASVPDGRTPAYLTNLQVSAKTVTFDLLTFLSDADAKKKWTKEHPGHEDEMPEDYFIVNQNQQLNTLPISPQVKVKVVNMDAPTAVGNKQINLSDLPAHLADNKPEGNDRRLSYLPFWLTVSHGQVTLMEEVYLP